MKQYMMDQKIQKQKLEEEYKKKDYTFLKPFIKVDPFGVAPLTAVVLFKESGMTSYRVIVESSGSYEVVAQEEQQILPIRGLKSGRLNRVMIQSLKHAQIMEECVLKIQTGILPQAYERMQVITLDGKKKANDYIALNLAATKGRAPRHNMCSILDEQGQVRWYYTQRGWNLFKQLKNNHVMMDAPTCIPGKVRYIPTGFVEMNFLGEIIRYFEVPNGLHHDVHEMPNGNFLVLTDGDDSVEDILLEIDRETGAVVRRYDFREILDVTRKPGIDKEVVNAPLDWLHLNSVYYHELDDTIIISSRNQNCVVKIDRQTQAIKWILGAPDHWEEQFEDYLLKSKGSLFEWPWAQHSAWIHEEGRLMLFDNGNFRSYERDKALLSYENYSRGVIYQIDEEAMTVEQIWQYGKERGNMLRCPYLGSISMQSNGNPLICFGGITKDRFGNPIEDLLTSHLKAKAHIVEVEKDTQKVVFEWMMEDCDYTTEDGFVCYRAEKINLYYDNM
ncbi:MAG: aryl-sulfate sulfotransferase [Cellulosilyticaceae bacterium]